MDIAAPQGAGALDLGMLGGLSLGSGREEPMLGVTITVREVLDEPTGEGREENL